MRRLIWVTALAVSVTVRLLALGSPPPADAKTRAECEQLEAALRSAISYEVNYTQQLKGGNGNARKPQRKLAAIAGRRVNDGNGPSSRRSRRRSPGSSAGA